MSQLCHFCEKPLDQIKNYAQCSKKRCSKIYCLDCIMDHLDKAFNIQTYKKDCFVCYSCGGTCTCVSCQKKQQKLSGFKASKIMVKRHTRNIKENEEKLEEKPEEKEEQSTSLNTDNKSLESEEPEQNILKRKDDKPNINHINDKYFKRKKLLLGKSASKQTEQNCIKAVAQAN